MQTADKPFIPSSSTLLAMIAVAEAKCDADREQARLRKAARAEQRMVRALTSAAIAASRKRRWGY
jgi:hypothetical protein